MQVGEESIGRTMIAPNTGVSCGSDSQLACSAPYNSLSDLAKSFRSRTRWPPSAHRAFILRSNSWM